ncbi:hypothetical protein MGAST_04865 [Mycobacterium gastri 'Wayne']|nr:hypothetical protein MGAST_04865 [Mycobacterium gastri 'Wayne']
MRFNELGTKRAVAASPAGLTGPARSTQGIGSCAVATASVDGSALPVPAIPEPAIVG